MEHVEIDHPVEGWNPVPGDPNAMVWWDGVAFSYEAVRAGDRWEVVGGGDEPDGRTGQPAGVARVAPTHASDAPTGRTDRNVPPIWGSGNAAIVMVIGGVFSVWLAWSFIHSADDYYPESENWTMIAYLVLAPLLLAPVFAAIWAVVRRPRNVVLAVAVPLLLATELFGVAVVGAWRSPPRSYARNCGSVLQPGRDSVDCTFWRNTQGGEVLVVLAVATTYAVIAGVGTAKAVRRYRHSRPAEPSER